MLVFIASVLDPRNRFEYLDAIFHTMYGVEEGSRLSAKVKEALFELFTEYKRIYVPPNEGSSVSTCTYSR